MKADPRTPRERVLAVSALLLFAAALRALTYTGFFGSDEVTYTEFAFKLLHGDWTVDPYVGANRYGINLPVALFGLLFGQNEFGAAFWSLACSVAEVGLLAWAAMRWFGLRTGIVAGVLLATLPIHVAYAGRLLADAPQALCISASFVLFFEGERRGSARAFFFAGVAAGLVFWIKQVTLFYLLVFLTYPLLFRRFDVKWVWMVLGFAATIAIHLPFFAALTGDPLYLVHALRARRSSGFLESGLADGSMVDGPAFYLDYLFINIYQTWLLGPLFVIGCWLGSRDAASGPMFRRALLWALGLVAALSVLPISFAPLVFVPKQTNYMLMFVAPLCLVAALAFERLSAPRLTWALGLGLLLPSLALALLQQASVRVFTANSQAAVEFARARPDVALYATTNAFRAATFRNLVEPARPPVRIGSMDDLAAAPADRDRLVILDTQTWAWASREPIRRLQDVPACWQRESTLTPLADGAGVRLAATTASLLEAAPALASVTARLRALTAPAPAFVYRLPAGCAAPAVVKAR